MGQELRAQVRGRGHGHAMNAMGVAIQGWPEKFLIVNKIPKTGK
jgi:hypothetical protein